MVVIIVGVIYIRVALINVTENLVKH